MKLIDISTKTHPKTFCMLDDDDYEWAKFFKWSPEQRRNTLYVCRHKNNGTHGSNIRIHREVMRARSFEHIDHINGDGLDNRKANLRTCSCVQNQQNRTKRSFHKSRFKGVFPRNNKRHPTTWFAYISINKKRFNLGTFKTDVEAAKEYDSKALYYFGDFARLNLSVEDTIPTAIEGYPK